MDISEFANSDTQNSGASTADFSLLHYASPLLSFLPSCRRASFVLEPPQVFNASADNPDMDTKVSAESRNQGLGRRAKGRSPQTQGVESVHRWPDALSPAEQREEAVVCPGCTLSLRPFVVLRHRRSFRHFDQFRPSSTNFDRKNISGPSGKNFPTNQPFRTEVRFFLSRSAPSATSCSGSDKTERNRTKWEGGSQNRALCINALQKAKSNVVRFSPTMQLPPRFHSSLVIRHWSLLPTLGHRKNGTFRDEIPPRVKMRRLPISNLRRGKWYSTISYWHRNPGRQFVGVHSWFQVPQPKLNKTERKGRGSKNRTLCINGLQNPKPNVVQFSHPTSSPKLYRSWSALDSRRSTLDTAAKMVLFETKHPRVKMRRLTINNLRREKWYSTIFRRRATTHRESVGGCRSNGKSRLLTVTNGCCRDSTPTTSHRSPLLPWCTPLRKPIISEHNSRFTAGNSRSISPIPTCIFFPGSFPRKPNKFEHNYQKF